MKRHLLAGCISVLGAGCYESRPETLAEASWQVLHGDCIFGPDRCMPFEVCLAKKNGNIQYQVCASECETSADCRPGSSSWLAARPDYSATAVCAPLEGGKRCLLACTQSDDCPGRLACAWSPEEDCRSAQCMDGFCWWSPGP